MAETEAQLDIVEQKSVLFYEDDLVAVRAADGQIYVSMRHICDALGLDRPSAVRRIKRHDVMAEGYKQGEIMTPNRGKQKMGLLRSDMLAAWLMGIKASKARPEIQSRLKTYQREAFQVLHEAFQSGRLSLSEDAVDFSELMTGNSDVAQAYQFGQAIMKLAQNQFVIEKRLALHGKQLSDNTLRIEQLEASFPALAERHISDAQASELSQAVRAIGMELSKRSGRNEYGGVYGELYRRFGITSYKKLPLNKFEEAAAFLTQWYQTITDSADSPF